MCAAPSSDWLTIDGCSSPRARCAELDRYIGYWKPYATSHDELDREPSIQDEVRNAAWTLLEAVMAKREGKLTFKRAAPFTIHAPNEWRGEIRGD